MTRPVAALILHPGKALACGFMLLVLSSVLSANLSGAIDDDLARRASWHPPTATETRDALFAWLDTQTLDNAVDDKIRQRWGECR